MAFDLGAIIARITADTTQFMAAMDTVNAATTGTAAKLSSIGDSVSKAGMAFMPFSIAAAGALGLSAKAAMDFNQQMEMLRTQAGASQQEVDTLKQKVLDLAPAVGFGPDKLAEALYHIESVGYRANDAMAILKIGAEGAAISGASLDDTVYALTSTMKTFGLEGVQGATDAMSQLNALVGSGDMKMQDLNMAIQTGVYSTAQTFGVSMQSMGAALAYLTDRGEKADVASTRLSMGITMMAAPAGKAAKLLSDLGMSSNDIISSQGAMAEMLTKSGLSLTTLADDLKKPDGIAFALDDLKTHMTSAGLTADAQAALIAKVFGGARTGKAIMALAENVDGVKQKFDAIGQGAKNFGDDWAAQQQQAAQKTAQFKAQLDVLEVKLGNAFLPTLVKVMQQIGNLADKFSNMSPGTQKAIADVLMFVAALGPVLVVVGNVIKFVGFLAGILDVLGEVIITVGAGIAAILALPVEAGIAIVLGVIAAVVALGVGIWQLIVHWKDVGKFFKAVFKDIADAIGDGVDKVKGLIDGFGKLLSNIWDLFTGGDPTTKGSKKYPWTDFMVEAAALRDKITGTIGAIPGEMAKWWNGLITDADTAWKKFIALFTWKNVLKGFYDFGFAVGTVVKTLLDFSTKTVPQFVNGVVTWFELLPGRVGKAMSNMWQSVTSWFTKTKDDATRTATDTWNGVSQWFEKLPGRVGNAVAGMYNAVTHWASQTWSAASNWAAATYNSVASWFEALPGRIWSAGVNMWNTANNVGNNIKNSIMGGINAIPGLLGNVLNNLWNMISNAVGTLGRKAADVGNAIWSGFKNAMGIHSPSYIEKAFTAIEKQGTSTLDTMKTHVSGLNQMASQVTNMALNSSAVVGAAAAGANNFTTNFHGNINISSDADASKVLSIISRNQELASRGLTTMRPTT